MMGLSMLNREKNTTFKQLCPDSNNITEIINNEQEIMKVCDLNEDNLHNLKRIRKCSSLKQTLQRTGINSSN